MRGALGGPRLLLRRLREVMAEPVNAQARLDRIVIHIAANMVAEVCSVYVARSDAKLELYATEGLNREAVHLTTMTTGEGLVGLIAEKAEPLALADAQAHPAFSYRPETGEEIYQSFLGVPILRGGNTLGVLVVQNRARRTYSEEEVEALQTTAMLLAEMIASGELQSLAQPGQSFTLQKPMALAGVPLCDGVGLGHVVLHEPRIVVKQLVAEDPAGRDAAVWIRPSRRCASTSTNWSRAATAMAWANIATCWKPCACSPTIAAGCAGCARRWNSGLTAEAAVERVQNDARAKLQRQTDPYLRERLHDLDDHRQSSAAPVDRPGAGRMAARCRPIRFWSRATWGRRRCSNMTATICAASCSRTAGQPAMSRSSPARSACRRSAKSRTSPIWSRPATPSSSTAGRAKCNCARRRMSRSAYGEKARLRARAAGAISQAARHADVTRDGVEIGLHMNAGLLIDCDHAEEVGAQIDRPVPHRIAVHGGAKFSAPVRAI